MKFHKLILNGADDTAIEKTTQMIVAVTVGALPADSRTHACGYAWRWGPRDDRSVSAGWQLSQRG